MLRDNLSIINIIFVHRYTLAKFHTLPKLNELIIKTGCPKSLN